MKPPFSIIPLPKPSDRASFDCGNAALNSYFRQRVTQDIKRRLSNCFVAQDTTGTIAGFYTLATTGLPLRDLDAALQRKLPRYPLLPAALIGRLAVDARAQGAGLGAALVVDGLQRVARSDPAIYAVLVDAKDEQAVGFYKHLGFKPLLSRPMSLFLPISDALGVLPV